MDPAITAVLGGQVPILFDNLFPTLPQVREGKLRALAVTTTERSPIAPEIPTMRESAPELRNYDVYSCSRARRRPFSTRSIWK